MRHKNKSKKLEQLKGMGVEMRCAECGADMGDETCVDRFHALLSAESHSQEALQMHVSMERREVMDTPQSKQQLTEQITQERTHWENLVEEVGRERMDEPGAMGEWTFKDLIAHMIGWWEYEIGRREAGLRGERPKAPSGIEGTEDWDADRVNQVFYDRYKHRSLDDVLNDSSSVWQRMEALVQSLPERDLLEPGRFSWEGGKALGPAILYDFSEHLHDEHEAGIREWLERLNTR
ncbi:MAG: hypothetical protein QOH93_242 [Chloroflexia bacterium]|nr:hypothetical protein [Chloroflexia bacterium]